jgi:ComF family protein
MSPFESNFQSLCARLIAHALPTACIACQAFQEKTLCDACQEMIGNEGLFNYECCSLCSSPLERVELAKQCCYSCEDEPPYFDETFCLDRYEGILQNALHALKYHRRLAFAHGLADVWNQFMAAELINIDASFLMPVPLSTQKLHDRGFNQTWEIARRLQCGTQIEKLPNALKRRHHEQAQAHASRTARNQVIYEMFYLEKSCLQQLQNKNIIVFDDVMTTGATLNEIARILKDNGATRVINWVMLRTQRPTSPRAQHV